MTDLMYLNSKQRTDILGDIKLTLDDLGLRKERKKNNLIDKNTASKDINIEKFKKCIIDASATISIVNSPDNISLEVKTFLHDKNISSPIAIIDPQLFDEIDGHGLNITNEYDRNNITVSMTKAWMAIEETGSLIMKSCPRNPTSLNFLPDYHIVILDRNSIVHNMNQVWKELRESKKSLPRTINIITGPSRTADIEHTIQLGAHGPRSLHVIVI